MTETKTRKPRAKKMFIVTMNGEVHFINAISKTAALNYAVSETVSVRPASLSDMADITNAVAKGAEIHEA
jgi:hypothetical protein